jgi:hypothetical protein
VPAPPAQSVTATVACRDESDVQLAGNDRGLAGGADVTATPGRLVQDHGRSTRRTPIRSRQHGHPAHCDRRPEQRFTCRAVSASAGPPATLRSVPAPSARQGITHPVTDTREEPRLIGAACLCGTRRRQLPLSHSPGWEISRRGARPCRRCGGSSGRRSQARAGATSIGVPPGHLAVRRRPARTGG